VASELSVGNGAQTVLSEMAHELSVAIYLAAVLLYTVQTRAVQTCSMKESFAENQKHQ